jgi:hypothetical protein
MYYTVRNTHSVQKTASSLLLIYSTQNSTKGDRF